MFATVIGALNTGFLATLKLFAVTLVGALPLGLVISFGSMSRFKPLRGLTRTIVCIYVLPARSIILINVKMGKNDRRNEITLMQLIGNYT